jgi:transposase
VVAGPDPEKDKVIRWRCLDLQEEIARRFSVRVHEGTVGKWLRQLGLTRLQPRPCHPKTDLAAQETLKKLRQPDEERPARHHRGYADRGLVPG